MNISKTLSPFCVSHSHLAGAISTLEYLNAASVPVLSEQFRRALLKEANSYSMRPVRETMGKPGNLVKQKMNVQSELNPDGLFGELATKFQDFFNQSVSQCGFFDGKAIFNDWMLQKYDVGSYGITPHRDRTDYRYIICLFVIEGQGRFYVSNDRQKNGQREIANLPGDVILLPAPGFKGMKERPFHYLEEITEERVVFGLRHDETKLA